MTVLKWYGIILIILMLGSYFYSRRYETSKKNEIMAVLILIPVLYYLIFS